METDLTGDLSRRVDLGQLKAHVAELATGERHGIYSGDRHAKAAGYIRNAFAEWGLNPVTHTFTAAGRSGTNVVASTQSGFSISGRGSRSLLVSAHYDTVARSPGADDNASGVAVMMECARVLSSAGLRSAVEFVAFDMEEIQPDDGGLLGSAAFAADPDHRDRYEGVYNLEMVGFTAGPSTQTYPPGFQMLFPSAYETVRVRDFRGDFMAAVSYGPGIELARGLVEAAERWVPDLRLVGIEIGDVLPLVEDAFRSDHASFWAAGVPALMLTDTADFRNPNYHGATDTADTLDYEFMTLVARALVAAVAVRAGVR